MRRLMKALVALTASGAAIFAVAPSAGAVDLGVPGCEFVDYAVPVGSTITFQLTPACWTFGGFAAQSGTPEFTDTTVTFTANGQWATFGTASDELSFLQSASTCDATTTNTYGPDQSYRLVDYCTVDVAPAAVLQQVGSPADGQCTSVSDPTLNWGGAGAGGWGRSWAQWMNDGRGGSVCTRTLAYSHGAGHYVVAAQSD